MNRRERRQVQKRLGLNEHYKKETREQKFARWRDNIENGKRMQEEMRVIVEKQKNMTPEEKLSIEIEILAAKIAQKKNIPIVDALVEAQEKIEKSKR